MTDTFTPPIAPSYNGTQVNSQVRQLSSNYGDGYTQVGSDGLNPIEPTATLAWDPINYTDASTIWAFLDAHVSIPFWYTLPRETAPRSWIWTQRQRTHPYPVQDALQVTLQRQLIP